MTGDQVDRLDRWIRRAIRVLAPLVVVGLLWVVVGCAPPRPAAVPCPPVHCIVTRTTTP